MKIIIINNVAAKHGGALTILKQLISEIEEDNEHYYYVFVSSRVILNCRQKNVKIVLVPKIKNFLDRLIWDYWGLKMWLKRNKIIPDVALSMQNTNFRTGYNINNYVYYHQPLPLFKKQWSFLKKKERMFFMYKNIYPFFVKFLINDKTKFFVQLAVIKHNFSNFFNVDSDRVMVVSPTFLKPKVSDSDDIRLDNKRIHLFYPSNVAIYKNHETIIEAIKGEDNILLHLTCEANDLIGIDCKKANIDFMGKITYNEVIRMYSKVDALVFPSYIETYGLPLLEAASMGLPIIASDLGYAREVVGKYEGTSFVEYDNIEKWKKCISNVCKAKRYKPFIRENTNGWKELLCEIKNANTNVQE